MKTQSNSFKIETQENKDKFFTKAGWLNAYGLSCGYIEKITIDAGYELELWAQHGTYFVRLWNNETMTDDSYLTTQSLTEARENFKTLKRNILSGLIKPV